MSWSASIHLTGGTAEIVVTDRELNETLRARLPWPHHPRALLTLLEAMALWSGSPIRGALSAAGPAPVFSDEDPFGLHLWPGKCPLVDVAFVLPPEWRERIEGPGEDRL